MIEEILTEAHWEFMAVFGGQIDEVFDRRSATEPPSHAAEDAMAAVSGNGKIAT